MARILFIYSTVDGHTLEICERLRQVVTRQGHQASMQELTADSEIDLEPFDHIIIGASVRYGKHRPDVTRFIEKNLDKLQTTPSAFFSVNAVARKPDKREVRSNPYVKNFLKKTTWKPSLVAIFGGKINYPIYRFWDKTIIRLIMWMTNGPTDPNAIFDFTDWEEVEKFGEIIGDID